MKRKDPTLQAIERLQKQREDRRKSADSRKKERETEARALEAEGNPGDVDFQRMIRKWREDNENAARAFKINSNSKITICVRKRPVNAKEKLQRRFDAVTCLNPNVIVHDARLKVDGISKYLENTQFRFDHTFDDDASTDVVYKYAVRPLVHFAMEGGNATCFAYGQTGSGKTHTMSGVQQLAARDVFQIVEQPGFKSKKLHVYVAFFEIYGGRCLDLLHDRLKLYIREDAGKNVNIVGLVEVRAHSAKELLELVAKGNTTRTTHATSVHDESSRSHAICYIVLRQGGPEGKACGKLSLIDLAGSERASETQDSNRQRRIEGAEINKSLLALKECVRAIEAKVDHIPYRASKLTQVLKDSFNGSSKTTMITTVSPTAACADHTLNTLRYADRIKENAAVDLSPALPGQGMKDIYPEEEDEEVILKNVKAGHYVEPKAISPTAQNLRNIAKLAKEGKITEKEKARAKNVILSNELESESIPEPAPKRQPMSKPRKTWEIENVPPHKPSLEKKLSTPKRLNNNNNNNNNNIHNIRREEEKKYVDEEEEEEEEDAGFYNDMNDSGEMADIKMLHATLLPEEKENSGCNILDLHEAVQILIEEEEKILAKHMEAIQENAELLTEEGKLLSMIQGGDVVDYDIDAYACRLDEILTRKVTIFKNLQQQLGKFRAKLQAEEMMSRRM